MDGEPPLCDGNIQLDASKFFRVVGTGNTLTASTCNPGSATFDTVISVFTSCGFQCVAGNDDGPAADGCGTPGDSKVSWPSVLGEEYTIIVGGVRADSKGGVPVTGDFNLLVSESS